MNHFTFDTDKKLGVFKNTFDVIFNYDMAEIFFLTLL